MKKTILFIFAILACHVSHAQYFCTTEGTELHYVSYDEAGQSVSNETAVVGYAGRNGENVSASYINKIVTNKQKGDTSYTRFDWNYDGNQTVCVEDLMFGPYIDSDSDPAKYDTAARTAMQEELKFKGNNALVLKRQAKAGESMPDRSYSLIANMLKNEITISGATYMGEERISTTAGKFDCLKISYLKRTKVLLKSTTHRINEWYAEGIGLVKSESFDMKGKPAGKTLLVKIVK
ncbi:TapB family protein [Phocaeicola salanitronis]|uniref:TapB family protein n=1 Tax=Phocaeicola salanitronis TaxID=376805 RepID=UPI00320B22CC